jgi:ssDNA-binding Zn-finger/Zn-ribbon topoisomerase 1
MLKLERLERCPLCNEELLASASSELYSGKNFICNNYDECHLKYVKSGRNFYLVKYLKDNTEIWWCSNGPCQMKFKGSARYEKLNFEPPFNIDENRLRKLLLFS